MRTFLLLCILFGSIHSVKVTVEKQTEKTQEQLDEGKTKGSGGDVCLITVTSGHGNIRKSGDAGLSIGDSHHSSTSDYVENGYLEIGKHIVYPSVSPSAYPSPFSSADNSPHSGSRVNSPDITEAPLLTQKESPLKETTKITFSGKGEEKMPPLRDRNKSDLSVYPHKKKKALKQTEELELHKEVMVKDNHGSNKNHSQEHVHNKENKLSSQQNVEDEVIDVETELIQAMMGAVTRVSTTTYTAENPISFRNSSLGVCHVKPSGAKTPEKLFKAMQNDNVEFSTSTSPKNNQRMWFKPYYTDGSTRKVSSDKQANFYGYGLVSGYEWKKTYSRYGVVFGLLNSKQTLIHKEGNNFLQKGVNFGMNFGTTFNKNIGGQLAVMGIIARSRNKRMLDDSPTVARYNQKNIVVESELTYTKDFTKLCSVQPKVTLDYIQSIVPKHKEKGNGFEIHYKKTKRHLLQGAFGLSFRRKFNTINQHKIYATTSFTVSRDLYLKNSDTNFQAWVSNTLENEGNFQVLTKKTLSLGWLLGVTIKSIDERVKWDAYYNIRLRPHSITHNFSLRMNLFF